MLLAKSLQFLPREAVIIHWKQTEETLPKKQIPIEVGGDKDAAAIEQDGERKDSIYRRK